MRKNDYTDEWANMVHLLDLRPGDLVIDAQAEADNLLPLLHTEVTQRGRCLGMCFGKETLKQVNKYLNKIELEEDIKIITAHPLKTPFKPELFHGVVLRHDLGFTSLHDVLLEVHRITRKGARILARHPQWTIKLPKATEKEQEMINSLLSAACPDGKSFFQTFEKQDRLWKELKLDVYTAATRDNRANIRYDYDWRTLMRDQLLKNRKYEQKDIIALIEKLEATRGSKVILDRYIIVAIRA